MIKIFREIGAVFAFGFGYCGMETYKSGQPIYGLLCFIFGILIVSSLYLKWKSYE